MESQSTFNERCYALLKLIPEGRVTTYKEMARALNTKAWRAVGTAMARNKKLIEIPCHRVVRSNGTIGEYALGSAKKAELLRGEGLTVTNGKILNLAEVFHKFSA